MNHSLRILLLAVFFGSAFGHQVDPQAKEVIDTLEKMWLAIERGDVEEYSRHIHEDYTAFGENDVYLLAGKSQEVRGIESYLKRARNVHTDMHQAEVKIRGDLAWMTYYWTDEGVLKGERFTSRGKSTRIFVREGGRWLCIHGHFTAVP